MPIYEYECKACGHRFEAIQKISDNPLTTCPECNENAVKKLISAAGFRLKGGGWYETDFKGKKQKNVVQSESKSDTKEASTGADKKATDTSTTNNTKSTAVKSETKKSSGSTDS